MAKFYLIILTILFFMLLVSCGRTNEKQTGQSSQEISETPANAGFPSSLNVEIKEESVIIGEQEWMLKNLDADTFRNGDKINKVENNPQWQEWSENKQAAWGYFLNDKEYNDTYGKIYNWWAVNDERGLCPTGWKVPSDEDWQVLIDNVGGEEMAALHLKADHTWEAGGEGTNKSGFAALPGGFRGYEGTSYQAGYFGAYWSSTEDSEFFAWGRNMVYDSNVVGRASGYKMDGFSVRCIRE